MNQYEKIEIAGQNCKFLPPSIIKAAKKIRIFNQSHHLSPAAITNLADEIHEIQNRTKIC